jgi:RNA polymerase sigma-70 factor, ECF subfamily
MDEQTRNPRPSLGMHAASGSVGTTDPSVEGSLVTRACAGDAAAFERLYRDNAARIYALCLRLSGDAARAEELTQDAFVRAWEKLGSFRGESAFSTWLHRLTVNLVLGARRSEGRRWSHLAAQPVEEMELATPRVAAPGTAMDLENAIHALPPAARTVFVMHEIEGYAHEEIARLTGRAEGTCKALLHRARKQLRETLS